MRFTIYEISDNNNGGCDWVALWDNDYRFSKKLKQLGQILCLDFEPTGTSFVTGSQTGWICIWDLEEKTLLRKFPLINPDPPKGAERCNLVRAPMTNRTIYCYNVKSQNLFQCKTRITQTDPSPPAPPEEPIDDQPADSKDKQSGRLSKRPPVVTPRKNKPGRRDRIDETDRIEVDTLNVFKH